MTIPEEEGEVMVLPFAGKFPPLVGSRFTISEVVWEVTRVEEDMKDIAAKSGGFLVTLVDVTPWRYEVP